MMQRPASPLVAFYGGGADHRGRTLEHMLGQDDAWLEQQHDFIQWLFPLPETSPYNPVAPTMRPSDIAAFAAEPELRQRLLRAWLRMLAFYGFDRASDPAREWIITPGARLAAGTARWTTPHDHNHLRITRILRCLHLLGCPAAAAAFLTALESLAASGAGQGFGAATLAHWRAAARGALWRAAARGRGLA